MDGHAGGEVLCRTQRVSRCCFPALQCRASRSVSATSGRDGSVYAQPPSRAADRRERRVSTGETVQSGLRRRLTVRLGRAARRRRRSTRAHRESEGRLLLDLSLSTAREGERMRVRSPHMWRAAWCGSRRRSSGLRFWIQRAPWPPPVVRGPAKSVAIRARAKKPQPASCCAGLRAEKRIGNPARCFT